MTTPSLSDHLAVVLADEPSRRRFAQNSLIVDAAIALNKALEASRTAQKHLAARLGRSEGFISQVLSGGANLTLRTLSDIAYGLDCTIELSVRPRDGAKSAWIRTAQPTLECPAIENAKAANTQLALAA